MSRVRLLPDEPLLEAARAALSERGIQATTADVARRAGVSEALLFKRFGSKGGLFRAALEPMLVAPPFLTELPGRIGHGDLHDQLVALGRELEQLYRRVVPVSVMALSAPEGLQLPPELAGAEGLPVQTLRAVTGYFEAEMRCGRLRRHDPEVAARTFSGAIHHYVVFDLFFGSRDSLPMPIDTFLRGLVHLLLTGMHRESSLTNGVHLS